MHPPHPCHGCAPCLWLSNRPPGRSVTLVRRCPGAVLLRFPMRILAYELSLAFRRLSRRPAQSLLVLVTLSVSLALSLLGWSLFHTMFFRQPEFDPNGTLLRIGVTGEAVQGRIVPLSRTDFEAWKSGQTVFADFAPAMLYQSTFVTTDTGIERFLGANLSSDVMRMVGARPLLGRLFTPDEDKLGCAPVILLSENVWRTRFGSDPQIVGRSVVVDGISATVVGVMPKSFRFPNAQELWQPLGFSPHEKEPTFPMHDIVARLKPGMTRERALEDLRLVAQRAGPDSVFARFNLQPVITPFREYYLHADMHRSALVLFALSLVFILVSCANAANLVMIDFFGRTAEIASSLALGIPRAAALRGFALQLLMIAAAAAALAFAVLLVAGPYVHSAMSRVTTPYWLLFSLQPHHIAMTLAFAVVSTLAALALPAGYMAAVNVEQLVRQNAGATRTTGRNSWRRALLVGQIGLLTVLAVSAALLLRSTRHVREAQWGFDGRSIFASKTSTPFNTFPTPELRYAAHQRFLDELERTPSVAAAGLMNNPVGFSRPPDLFYAHRADELSAARVGEGAVASAVTPGLFDALGVPFIEGETFARDTKPVGPRPVNGVPVIITHGIAQKLWPGESALGRGFYARVGHDPKQPPVHVIVRGVVRAFQASGPKAKVNEGVFTFFENMWPPATFLYVRGKHRLPPFEDVRAAAARADPRMAVYFPNTLRRAIDIELSSVHLTTTLTVAYALAAVLLCVVGIYSVTVSQIVQRHREFGIRMALGIEARRLWVHFARGHVLTASIGLAAGLVGAVAAARLLSSLLFGVEANDIITFASVGALIFAVAVLACVPSFFRLRRVNPADCLRSL